MNNVDGTVTAENNWWGCNAGPGSAGCDTVTGVADSNPWIVLAVNASPTSVQPGGMSTVTADMSDNSASADTTSLGLLPTMPVAWSATQGTMSPTSGTITSDMASSTFTSTSGSNGTGCAMVDNQLTCAGVTVTAPTVQFSSSTYSVNENAGTVTLTITKTGTTALSATVNYSTSDGTATQPGDYTATSGSVTFLPSETSKDITVPITNDSTFESSESFTVTLSAPTNATLGSPSTATVTINDDDSLPLVQFSAANYNVGEAAGTVTITVTKTGSTAVPCTVNYATSDGSATAGSDYTTTSGMLTFLPGDTSKTFTVPITQDSVYEGNETFNVTLSAPVGASLGSPNPATVTIVEDDAPPAFSIDDVTHLEGNSGTTSYVFTVTKTGSTALNSTVDYQTVNGTATAPSDYTAVPVTTLTFLPGDTSKQVTVLVNGDLTHEADETFTVHLSNPTAATISDADGLGTITNDDACYEPAPNMVAWYPGDGNFNDIQGPTFENGTNTNGVHLLPAR